MLLTLLYLGLTFVLALAGLVIVYIVYMSWTRGVLEKQGFVGPKPTLILGTLGGNIFENIIKHYTEFKHNKVYLLYMVRFPTISVASLDMVSAIMHTHFKNFPDRRSTPMFGYHHLDNGIQNLRGHQWKQARKAIGPAFSTNGLKEMAGHIEKTSCSLIKTLIKKQESGEPVDLKLLFASFTIDVIGTGRCGIELNTLENYEQKFVTNIMQLEQQVFYHTNGLFYMFPFIKHLPSFLIPRLISKDIDPYALEFLLDAKKKMKTPSSITTEVANSDKMGAPSNDFSPATNPIGELNVKMGGVTYDASNAAGFTFILAGNQSRNHSFTMFMIANHPEVLSKCQEEIDTQLQGEAPTFTNIKSLTYLDWCISETLRLYPTGFILERKCVETVTIEGVTFPEGYCVSIPVWAIHRDPAIYPDPDAFLPERWSPEQKAGRHPSAYMPFGDGPRNCVGMRLSNLETKLTLAAVLQTLTPAPCDKTVFPIVLEENVLAAKDGLWLKFNLRKANLKTK